MSDTLLIRADASPRIGTGHVMRCLALAQQWKQKGARVFFAQAETTTSLQQRLLSEGIELIQLAVAPGSEADADLTTSHARQLSARWIVADSYTLGAAWQKRIKDSGLCLLAFDDYGHAGHYHADLVLNQNIAAHPHLYTRRDTCTGLLLGSQYTLLRQEFLQWRSWKREIPERAAKILVSLGGSDPDNVTGIVVQALTTLPGVEAVVVVGGSNPNLESLRRQTTPHAPNIRLVIDAQNMPELMAWADIAVSAAGSTSWELAFMGLPTILIITADNQTAIARGLEERAISLDLGAHQSLTAARIADEIQQLASDAARRSAMSALGRKLIDGHGARRVCAALKDSLVLTLVSDRSSWINDALHSLKTEFEAAGHEVRWIHDPSFIEEGDIAFLLSLGQIVPSTALTRHAHNLVVHESALPQGRGWSPLTWQILEGKQSVQVTLFEAADSVDSGRIYLQDTLRFDGHELVDELRQMQASSTLRLCREFVSRYPLISAEGREQTGTASFYPRRRPEDSRLDLDKPLRDQFNLLRVADPARYPAFFELGGYRYEVRITRSPCIDTQKETRQTNHP